MSICGTFQSLLIGSAPAPTYSTVVMIHGDGNLTESSPNGWTLIPTHTANWTTALSKWGSGCIDCTPNNFARIATPTNSTMSPGSADYQVEIWFRPTSTAISDAAGGAIRHLFSAWDAIGGRSVVAVYMTASFGSPTGAALSFVTDKSSGNWDITWAADTWHHVALVVQGNDLSGYVDGNRVFYHGTGSKVAVPSPLRWDAGGYDTALSGRSCQSYFDDFRLIVGGVTYSGATYTVPTGALPDSP